MRRSFKSALVSASLFAATCMFIVSGCGSNSGETGVPDGGGLDDAGVDAGDAGPDPDGGLPDGSVPDGGTPDGGTDRFHRSDYERPELHGEDLRLGALDCRFCHGSDLTGADQDD